MQIMQHELLSLLNPRKGHFKFESGYHGDLWLEVDARLFLHPPKLAPFVRTLSDRISRYRIEAVSGRLIGGAFIAQLIAPELDVQFYYAERIVGEPVGYKIPHDVRAGLPGKNVAIVDDVINAGSAIGATMHDLDDCGARIVAIGALMTLGQCASALAVKRGVPLETLGNQDRKSTRLNSSHLGI